MLDWVITLLVALGVATGGVAGVSVAKDHASVHGDAALQAEAAGDASAQAADPTSLIDEIVAMMAAHIAAAAEQADSHAQDALTKAAEHAASGLATARDAVSAHGQADADAGATARTEAAVSNPAPIDVPQDELPPLGAPFGPPDWASIPSH